MSLAIINARVHTMDAANPVAQAIYMRGSHIAAVGGSDEIRAHTEPGTRVVDARGCTLLPGFNDAHVHFISGGFSLMEVDLRPARSPEQLAALLAGFASRATPGGWILGGDWDHELWPGAPLPVRQMIDPASGDRPVFIRRLDGHMALANTIALQRAGIDRQTPDPPGGEIVRDPNTREPTGLLKDAAMELVNRILPAPSSGEKLRALRAATQHAASLGVTSVTDVSADGDVGLYQELLQRGELKTRIYGARTIVSWKALAEVGIRAGFGNPMLRIGAVKGFADGSLGSSTALFFEPYADAPGMRGLLFDQMLPEGIMLERVLGADQAGLQVLLHAIGDRANRIVLDLYEDVARQNGKRDRRFRIEHAQHLRPDDLPRFGRQQVIASVQPYHAADDGRWCAKRLGPARCAEAYCFRSLLDSGAVLAFGSDWTVAPLNPLPGIKAAVTRQTLDGAHPNGWHPEQRLTLDEALHAYTMGSAFAEFTEHDKGSLTVGKLADAVLLDRDIYSIPPDQIDQARVALTVLNGEIVFAADGL